MSFDWYLLTQPLKGTNKNKPALVQKIYWHADKEPVIIEFLYWRKKWVARPGGMKLVIGYILTSYFTRQNHCFESFINYISNALWILYDNKQQYYYLNHVALSHISYGCAIFGTQCLAIVGTKANMVIGSLHSVTDPCGFTWNMLCSYSSVSNFQTFVDVEAWLINCIHNQPWLLSIIHTLISPWCFRLTLFGNPRHWGRS